MSYKINKISDLKIIKVTACDTLSFIEKKKAYTEAINELSIYNYQRLLFDVRNIIDSEKHTVGDSIDLFNTLKKLISKKGIKSAFISSDHKGEHKIFGVIFKTILDIDMKHFVNDEEAIEWLCME